MPEATPRHHAPQHVRHRATSKPKKPEETRRNSIDDFREPAPQVALRAHGSVSATRCDKDVTSEPLSLVRDGEHPPLRELACALPAANRPLRPMRQDKSPDKSPDMGQDIQDMHRTCSSTQGHARSPHRPHRWIH